MFAAWRIAILCLFVNFHVSAQLSPAPSQLNDTEVKPEPTSKTKPVQELQCKVAHSFSSWKTLPDSSGRMPPSKLSTSYILRLSIDHIDMLIRDRAEEHLTPAELDKGYPFALCGIGYVANETGWMSRRLKDGSYIIASIGSPAKPVIKLVNLGGQRYLLTRKSNTRMDLVDDIFPNCVFDLDYPIVFDFKAQACAEVAASANPTKTHK